MWIKLSLPQRNIIATIGSNGAFTCSLHSAFFCANIYQQIIFVYVTILITLFPPWGQELAYSNSVLYLLHLGRYLPLGNVIAWMNREMKRVNGEARSCYCWCSSECWKLILNIKVILLNACDFCHFGIFILDFSDLECSLLIAVLYGL